MVVWDSGGLGVRYRVERLGGCAHYEGADYLDAFHARLFLIVGRCHGGGVEVEDEVDVEIEKV